MMGSAEESERMHRFSRKRQEAEAAVAEAAERERVVSERAKRASRRAEGQRPTARRRRV